MKLYYSPGACSMSPHIVLEEAGVAYDTSRVDLKTHKTETGEDYYQINRKGAVPALELDEGGLLTEGVAIIQFIGDHYAPALLPANGTLERARLQEMLNYLAVDYHKSFAPLFNTTSSEDIKANQRNVLTRKLTYLESVLDDGRPFLMGDAFTVADAYLFTVTSWAVPTGFSIEGYPSLVAFMERMAQRPSVQAVLKAEGLAA